ncbi:hypothetical protein D3C72_1941360 [compost metagenome]
MVTAIFLSVIVSKAAPPCTIAMKRLTVSGGNVSASIAVRPSGVMGDGVASGCSCSMARNACRIVFAVCSALPRSRPSAEAGAIVPPSTYSSTGVLKPALRAEAASSKNAFDLTGSISTNFFC